jgi:hypothetical protein
MLWLALFVLWYALVVGWRYMLTCGKAPWSWLWRIWVW